MTSICHLYHSFAFLASFDESYDHCRISQALLKCQCLSVKCARHGFAQNYPGIIGTSLPTVPISAVNQNRLTKHS